MPNQTLYSQLQLQVYPLQLFILFVGICIGLAINRSRNNQQSDQQSVPAKSQSSKNSYILKQNHIDTSILSYSLSTGQSFQREGVRLKLFKGHLYEYFPILGCQSQQNKNSEFRVNKSVVKKIEKDGQCTKFYNSSITFPLRGKYYFQISVVRNQYFVKRQAPQKSSSYSNIAISRSDIIIGFLLTTEAPIDPSLAQFEPSLLRRHLQTSQLCDQSYSSSNSIPGISGYGFNGRIYDNGQLRTEEKIIRKNKVLTVLVNVDDGYLAYEVDGETVGICLLPRDRKGVVPFLEMYAVGTAVVVSG